MNMKFIWLLTATFILSGMHAHAADLATTAVENKAAAQFAPQSQSSMPMSQQIARSLNNDEDAALARTGNSANGVNKGGNQDQAAQYNRNDDAPIPHAAFSGSHKAATGTTGVDAGYND